MSVVTLPQVTSLVSTLIWPLVILTLGVLYRHKLGPLLDRLAARVSRLSFAGASIELVSASEPASATLSSVTDFIDAAAGPSVMSSDTSLGLEAAIYTSGADFVKIDLRTGRAWLTSRLYLFSLILDAAGVKRLVFVQTTHTGPETVVGIAEPLNVANRLATRFRWFDYALADAKSSQFPSPHPFNLPDGPRPADVLSDATWASYVSRQYLSHALIQANPQVTVETSVESQFSYTEGASSLPEAPGSPSPPDAPAADMTPRVTAITPWYGAPAGGTVVTVTGENLGGANWVELAAVPTSNIVQPASDTVVRAVAPAGVGRGDVRVSAAGRWSIPSGARRPEFWYTSYPPPRIARIEPQQGPSSGGTTVKITGSGLERAREVRFGDARAAVTNRAANEITAITPPGAGSAPVAVVTPAGSSRAEDDWVVVHHSSGGDSDYAEHAEWIRDGGLLISLLRGDVDQNRIVETTGLRREDLQRKILQGRGDFVCLVDERQQFRRLIDRRATVERAVAASIETSPSLRS